MSTFVFVHIPKTGGLSAAETLQQLVSKAGFLRCNDAALPSAFGALELLTSHHFFKDVENVQGEKYFLTTVRDPLRRCLSMYRFWRSIRPDHAICLGYSHVTAVHGMSFDEFIQAPVGHPAYFADNEMTRQFSNANGPLTEEDFEVALSNLEKCEAIFRTEFLDEDLKHFFEQVGCGQRYQPVRLNVTAENHKVYPDCYRASETVDLASLSEAASTALLEKTSFDRRFYKAALEIAERKRQRPLAKGKSYPIDRGRIARGEFVVPGNNVHFRSILGRGWGPPESILWSTEQTAALVFKVKDEDEQHATAVLEIDICPLSNRKYLIVNVKADDQPSKAILFLQSNTMLPAQFLSTRKFDLICTAPRSARLELDLTPFCEDRPHTIEISHDGAASPALLGHNHDERLIGSRLVSLGIM